MTNKNSTMHAKRIRLSEIKFSAKIEQGIALLESMIAIVIFSMGILALAGLQSVLVKNTSDAKYRAEATFIAQQSLGRVWVGSGSLADSAEVDTDISDLLPNGTRTVAISPERVVTVTIRWQLPGEDEHTYTTNARIEGI